MISFIDNHLLSLLNSQWQQAKAAGLPAWLNLFRSTLPEDYLTKAWAELNRLGIQFRSSFTPVVESNSMVIIGVSLESDELEQGFLNYSNDPRGQLSGQGAHDRFDWISTATTGVYTVAPNKDLVRVLNYFVQCAILSAIEWFIAQGVSDVRYLSSRDLVPEPELEPHAVNVYMRVQRWAFTGPVQHGRIGGDSPITNKWVTANDIDTFVDGYLDRDTHTLHQLQDNLPGGIEPVPSTE